MSFQGQGQPGVQKQQFQPGQQTVQGAVKAGGPGKQAYYSPAPPGEGQEGYYQAAVPEFKVAGVGGPAWDPSQGPHQSRHTIDQLRQSDGIVPLQYGTNRYASQKKMTSFGTPRDVNGRHLHRIWDDFYTDESQAVEGQQQQQQYYQ